MKYIISETQFDLLKEFKFLVEQSDEVFDWKFGIKDKNMEAVGLNPSVAADRRKYDELTYQIGEWDHDTALMLSLICLAIPPPVGPAISALILTTDSTIYLIEGDQYSAGLGFLFALIPYVGSALRLLKFVPKLGTKGTFELARKIVMAEKLTRIERRALIEIMKNKVQIAQKISEYVRTKFTNSTILQIFPSKIIKLITDATAGLVSLILNLMQYFVTEKLYNEVISQEIRIMVNEAGYDWEGTKKLFVSNGSLEDNEKLLDAWDKGWRPPNPVLEIFQTHGYKEKIRKEKESKIPYNSLSPKDDMRKKLGIKDTEKPGNKEKYPFEGIGLQSPFKTNTKQTTIKQGPTN